MAAEFVRTKTTRLITLAERRRRLVEKYGHLVKTVARRMARRIAHAGNILEEDDLYSIGIMGLFDAEARYDESSGHSFENFAEFRIKGAMLDELRRRDFMPRRLRLQANKLKAAKTRLQKALDREPTHDEIAAALELDIEAYQVLRRKVAAYHFVPMENLYDLQSEAPSPLEQYEERQKVELFTRLIQQLKERERLVLDLYFFRDLNLREIGDVLGLTEGRISQIKSGAIARLREMAAEAHAVTAAA